MRQQALVHELDEKLQTLLRFHGQSYRDANEKVNEKVKTTGSFPFLYLFEF
jgi:hypothetical protein